MKKFYTITIWLFFVSVFFSSNAFSLEKSPPVVVSGVLDLSDWSLKNSEPVHLEGDWEFYWNEFLAPNDFSKEEKILPSGFIPLPKLWNHHQINNKSIEGQGFATYRLKVKLQEAGEYGLKIKEISTAYRLWVNGVLVSSNGIPGRTMEAMKPQLLPKSLIFTTTDTQLDIVIHVSNFYHPKGGIGTSILLGSKDQILSLREKNLSIDLFLFGTLIVMGFYHLSLFGYRKKEHAPLYLGLYCFLVAVRIAIVSGERFLLGLYPELEWETIYKISYLTFYMGVPLFFMFLESLFPEEFSKKILRLYQIVGVSLSLLVLFTTVTIYSYSLEAYQIFTLAFLFYGGFGVIRAILKKREGSIWIASGTILFFVTVINDNLYTNRYFDIPELVPFGLFLFILTQSFALSQKFSIAFTKVESFSKELTTKNRRLHQLDLMKDEFLATTSHELRTPLHGMISLTESVVEKSADRLSRDEKEDLELVQLSGRRLSNLINDILDFSRLKNGDISLELKPVDIKSTVNLVMRLSQSLIRDKSVRMENRISDHIPPVLADENRLQQILQNLLGNAVKFTSEGEICVTAKLQQDTVIIMVEDTGIGIKSENLDVIFESYQSGDEPVQRQYGGTGLGLSISKKLVELHQGKLWVESEEGIGSCFSFQLPLAGKKAKVIESGDFPIEIDLNARLGVFDPVSEEIESEYGCSILLVDDDPLNHRILHSQLNGDFGQLVSRLSGLEAIAWLKSNPKPDLVLLDVMMPGQTGFEVCNKIREMYSAQDLPVIFLTARNQVKDLVEGFSMGGNDYLAKPYSKDELKARIQTQLSIASLAKRFASINEFMNQLYGCESSEKMIELLFNEINRELSLDFSALYENEMQTFCCGKMNDEEYENIDGLIFQINSYQENVKQEFFLFQDMGSPVVCEFSRHSVGNHLVIRIPGFEIWHIYLYRLPELGPFLKTELEYLINLVEGMKRVKKNIQETTGQKRLIRVISQIEQNREQLLYIKASSPYCEVVMSNEEPQLHRVSLDTLHMYFDEPEYFRVHKSYLVSTEKVIKAEKKGQRDFKLLLHDCAAEIHEIPVSRNLAARLKQKYPEWFAALS